MTDRRFGIEIETKGITKERAAKVLRLVGLQVAIEGYNHTARNHWKIVTDASVRGGFEVVSPVLQGEEGLEAVRAAITALDDAGATVNRSCGLHVHFDASGLTALELKNIVLRYASFERRIDRFMPPSRRDDSNTYCKSLRTLAESPSFRNARTIHDLVTAQGSRYFKVNLQSYQRHGTVEFRQHSGTVNAPKAVSWVRFLASFIEASREAQAPAATAQAAPPLTGKQASLLELIQGVGASTASLTQALGWQPHTLRAAITRLRQAGIQVATGRTSEGTTYRAESAGPRAEADDLFRGVEPDVRRFYEYRTAVLAA